MKVGLALGGGGVKGMAHVGVFRAFEREHIPIDIVAGSSSGALAGALYASGKTASEIEDVARKATFLKWFARDNTGLGLFSTNGIHRLIDDAIGEDVNIEDLPRQFMCVAVDVDTQEEVVFDSGPLADAVCASCAYPGLYAPVRLDGRLLFDGGVLNPVPFDVVRRYGADRVIAVDLGSQEPFFTSNEDALIRQGNMLWQTFYSVSHQKMFRVVQRSIGIMMQSIRDTKCQQSPPDIMILPRVEEVGLLDFHLVEACFGIGDAAACLALSDIAKMLAPPQLPARRGGWQTQIERIKDLLTWRRASNL